MSSSLGEARIPTDELPFFFVHGPWVWKLALLALIGAVLLAIRAIRMRGARRALRDETARLERDGVIRGVLGGGGTGVLAATLRAERGPETVESWRAGALWLDTDRGRIAIEGPLEVIAGSRAAAARNGVPSSMTDEHLRAAAVTCDWLHRPRSFWRSTTTHAAVAQLRAGDEVVATGSLEPAAGVEPTSYREGAVAWTLRTAGDAPIQIAARKPRAAIARMPLWITAALAAFTVFAGYQAAALCGDVWTNACWEESGAAVPVALSNAHPCTLARTMPDGGRVARELLHWLDEAPRRDERTLRQALAVAPLVEGCNGVVYRLHEYERYEAMAAHAHACGDRGWESSALVTLGRFDEAAALPAGSDRRAFYMRHAATTLIGAGRWNEAAEAATQEARQWSAGDGERAAFVETHYHCLAELLRHHGGDRDAIARLRALRARPDGARCAAMLAEIAPPDERTAILRDDLASDDAPELAHAIAWAAGFAHEARDSRSPEETLVRLNEEASAGVSLDKALLIALEHERLRDELPHDSLGLVHTLFGGARASRLRWLAVAQVLDDDLAGAAASAHAAMRLRGAERDYPHRDLPLLPAAVALYSPAMDTPLDLDVSSLDEEFAAAMRREQLAWIGRLLQRAGRTMEGARLSWNNHAEHVLTEARAGRGEPLAKYLVEHAQYWWSDGDLIAVLPRITSGRDALVQQIVWGRKPRATSERTPFELAAYAVGRRTVLRLAGATDEAARWDATYRRFAAMFRDRRKLVAMLMWARPQR